MQLSKSIILSVAIVAGLVLPSATIAGNVPFPKEGAAAKDAIIENCPTCLAAGVTLCGTVDVQFGKRFSRAFFAGAPKRGYLPGFRLSGQEFRTLARTMSYAAAMQSLRQTFVSLPLAIIDDGFAAARVIAEPISVEVTFPEGLHQCVRDPANPWGCCVAADCRSECCEKSLGSPQVAVHWDDHGSGDALTFRFSHTLGASTLTRETADGTTFLYWCKTDEPGWLQ
jgi:hypothetical protein